MLYVYYVAACKDCSGLTSQVDFSTDKHSLSILSIEPVTAEQTSRLSPDIFTETSQIVSKITNSQPTQLLKY